MTRPELVELGAPKWRPNSWYRGQCHISLKKTFLNKICFSNELDPLDDVKI
jgi:hypothetical protein